MSQLQQKITFTILLSLALLLAACAMPATPQGAPVSDLLEEAQEMVAQEGGEGEAVTGAPAPAAVMPEATDSYGGIPVGFTPEGYPFIGAPDAPIVVYEYSDYECPFCARHVVQTEPALKASFVADGQVRFVFRDFPLVQLHPRAIPVHVAANCVGEQGAAAYWSMRDRLFRTQQEWSRSPDPQPIFARLASEVGVDMDAFEACVADDADLRADIQAALAEGQALGFTGTPSFNFVRATTGESFALVGAQPFDVFAGYFDTLLAGGSPVDPAEAQRQAQQQAQGEPQIPYWATDEGLSPDPNNPLRTRAGDFWKGSPDAIVTVVEFSDFQCSFCRRHAQQTQPILDELFVDTGDVKWVFKHFPTLSPGSLSAAIASECAGDQGLFWEMKQMIFERTEQWSIGNPAPVFASFAEELGADVTAFNLCYNAPDTRQKAENDLREGSAFVQGTPTFVVLYNTQGRLIPGALAADQFTAALEQLLAEARRE
jgi:protein-disulfide isomerase